MIDKVLSQLIGWETDNGVLLRMVSDHRRNQFYDSILKDTVTGKNCIDVGFGTGLLSFLALKYNPKHITAYEVNAYRYQLGCDLIKSLKLQDKITLVHGRYYNSSMIKDHEVLFHETVSTELWDEGIYFYSDKNPDLTILPSEYVCDYYLYELADDEYNNIITHSSKSWCDLYTAYKGVDWPNVSAPGDYFSLPNWVKEEIDRDFPELGYKFNPGVTFDIDYISELQKYISDYQLRLVDNKVKMVFKKSVGIDNGEMLEKQRYKEHLSISKKVVTSIVDPVKKTAMIINHLDNTQKIVDIDDDKLYLEICLDKELVKGKRCLLLPKFSIKHKDIVLSLLDTNTFHLPQTYGLINNVSTDVNIRHYIDSDSGIKIYI
jgi:hypothetical protein